MTKIGEAENIQYAGKDSKFQLCTVDGILFEFERADFANIEEGTRYEFLYLPNSKYLVDIIDENGDSLLKR